MGKAKTTPSGKTITIRPQLEEAIFDFCDDELNYHINESHCAEDYEYEIMAQIELLELLGYKDRAKRYRADYKRYCKENGIKRRYSA